MKKNYKKEIFYLIIILILLVFIFLYFLSSYENYLAWKSHNKYLKQPNVEIQPWMSIGMISKLLSVSIEEIISKLNVNKNTNPRTSLDEICKKYNQNCTETIERLNNLKRK